MRRLGRNLRQRQLPQAIKALLSPPDFFAPLTHNLLLTNGQGVATFTRATAAYCLCYAESDNSGATLNWQQIPAGIPRFEGARFIASNNTWSDKFANGAQIPAATLKGIMIEQATTNLIINSNQLVTGTFREITNSVAGTVYTLSMSGVATVALSGSASGTLTSNSSNPSDRVGLTFTAGFGSFAITVSSGTAASMQVESKPMATSYIYTNATALTRNADVLTYPNANNVLDTAGTVILEATPAFNIPNSAAAGFGSNYLIDFGSDKGSIFVYTNLLIRKDGTNVISSPSFIPMKGTTYKIGSRYGSAGQRNWLNGVAGTNGSFDGSINSGANMTVGGFGGGTDNHWGGNIKNLKIYKKALSDSEITAGTS